MFYPGLETKLADMRYEALARRLGLPLFLMLLPLAVFAGVTQVQYGFVSALALVSALATYSVVLSFGVWTIHREARRCVRATHSSGKDYEPPSW